MIQLRVRAPNDSVTGFNQAQTKIDVIECDREVGFVETAKLKVKLFAQDHASTRDGGKVLQEMGAREIPIFIANAGVGVIGRAADSKNYTAVLHDPIGIPKARTHRPDFGASRVTYHFGKPSATFHFEIVIEQRDEGSARTSDADVVQAAEIKRALDSVDFCSRGLTQLRKIFERPWVTAFVVENDDFEIWIIGVGADALNAFAQEFDMVARRNDDRDKRFIGRRRVFGT